MSVFLFFARYTPLKKTRRHKFKQLLRISIFVRYNIVSNNKITLFIFICQITAFNYRASGGKWVAGGRKVGCGRAAQIPVRKSVTAVFFWKKHYF